MRKRYNVQLAVDEDSDTRILFHRKNSIHSVNILYAVLILICLIALFGIVVLIDSALPKPFSIEDEKQFPNSFITERAQKDLKVLTDIGPRVVGSYENEILAADFLGKELASIKQQASSVQDVEIDLQLVTGSYYLNFKPFGGFNSYGNVQNIIVKVNSRNQSMHSLLINAHFDSVPTSPGGSDDGINCAVMLEVLRKISRMNERPEHNIIFLFNGAEETPLQAAHGFITQHKWAESVRVVINLEAAGSGGKEILFQTGPNEKWLMKYFNMVPHPHGQAAGEEIFQTNLIPSDTDFRIFRDFGNTIGYDLAFARNGYRYHTNYDDFSSIPLGSYQHVGDNILSLVKSLANAPELANPKVHSGNAVFFDIFGLFMISYGETTAIVINIIVVILSVGIAVKSFKDFELGLNIHVLIFIGKTICAILLGWILAVGFVYVTTIVIDALNVTMSWYGNPCLLFGLYAVPTVMCTCVPIILLNNFCGKKKFCISVQSQIQSHIIRLVWTLVILIGTCVKIRTVYAIVIPVLFNTVAFFIIHLLRLQHSVVKWKVICLVSNIFPTMTLYYQMILILSLFIPITGRIGSNRNPEIIVGLITSFLTILISCLYVNLVTLVRKAHFLIYGFLAVFIVTFVIVFTPWGFPYSGNSKSPAPQRFMIYHTSREFHDYNGDIIKKDAGYFILNLDRNSPSSIKPYVKELSRAKSVSKDCETVLVCGLPLITPRMLSVMEESTWIPAEEPIIPETIELKLNSKIILSPPTLVRYNFTATGPDHMNVYLSSKSGTTIVNISLANTIPKEQVMWNGRPIFFINHAWGREKSDLNFYCDIDIEPSINSQEPVLDIAVSGKYVHKKNNENTQQYDKFIKEFPNWANIVSALANFKSFVF